MAFEFHAIELHDKPAGGVRSPFSPREVELSLYRWDNIFPIFIDQIHLDPLLPGFGRAFYMIGKRGSESNLQPWD